MTSRQPDVVAGLRQLAQAMDGDLGITAIGPGVRPPDEAADPEPSLKKE